MEISLFTRWSKRGNRYAQIPQRWLVVKSQPRLASDLKQLEKRLAKQFTLAASALKQLESQRCACQAEALTAARAFSQQLPYHQLHDLQAHEIVEHQGRGRPRKDAVGQKYYRISATLVPKAIVISNKNETLTYTISANNLIKRCGRMRIHYSSL